MPGYYSAMPIREPVPMGQLYPPARSYSLAKLNQYRDYTIYDKVKVDNAKHSDRRPPRIFDQLRRQKSYDGDAIRKMCPSQPRRPEGFDSLQLLGANTDDRYLDRFMDGSRGRPVTRDVEHTKNKNTLLSNKSNTSKSSSNSNKSKENKKSRENSLSSDIMALLGSLKHSASVDNIYESVEQIHYRKSMEMLKRREKVRSVHRTGHPLFDHLREERAMASVTEDKAATKRISRSAGPSRKTSVHNSPTYSSQSSGDEQEYAVRRNRVPPRSAMTLQHPHHQQRYSVPSWRRTGSAGSESDDEWVIPRPKIGRRREIRAPSTDESDSSSKSSPMR